MADLAENLDLELKETPLFKKDGTIPEIGRESAISQAAFKLKDGDIVGDSVVEGKKGYYVIALKDKKIPADDEISENIKSVKDQLFRTKQSEMYVSWIDKLKSKSTIEIQPGLIDG